MSTNHFPTGFMLIQGNRLEELCNLLVAWLKRHPLQPLENDVVLVQSNGIAQWLKLAIAADVGSDGLSGGCGIAAALKVTLPARFIWQAYRQVLGDLPDSSPFDKAPLTWRLYRLLGVLDTAPALTSADVDCFAPLTHFLSGEDHLRRRHQLAARLADLYDQYQVYRADWLTAWQQHDDVLIRPQGEREPIPTAQRWQPALWRWLVADINAPTLEKGEFPFATASRADVHREFLTQIKAFTSRPAALPRRVIVFGISALPRQWLEVLAAIAAHTQVLLFVHNPSQHYWGDLIEGRELFRSHYRRTAARKIPPALDPTLLHLHGHPLLAAWGKQGRDYLRMLDEYDERTHYAAHFERAELKIDLFTSPGTATLLHQLQDDILQLRPLSERQALAVAIDPATDRSIEFLVAHSPLREVEILHDQLLDAFAAAAQAGTPLAPREVLVMVPDVNLYAPHVSAVFGRLEASDPRYIPFHLSDQGQRQRNPVLLGLATLLNLPQARFTVTELLDLLDIAAVRGRFRIAETDLPPLRRWIGGANIRWGLSAEHRASLNFPVGLEQNTWRFGLRRMVLGFATGTSAAWQGIEPYDEIGGLDAALIGPLVELLTTLEWAWQQLQTPRPPTEWMHTLTQLMDAVFLATTEADVLAVTRVTTALEQWTTECQQAEPLTAGAEVTVPLEVVREAVLAAVDAPTLTQRFFAGAVNVATLMPMRAIPFRHIWLLGMNDGDYPRHYQRADFDLMAKDYRPGDRSRREDDRYLFLEALLSAREHLAISWVGRSIRDDSPRPPSVLVGQLRDHLAAGWRLATASASASGEQLLAALTTEHPLQPFSVRYFQPDRPQQLFTYASEWRAAHAPIITPLATVPHFAKGWLGIVNAAPALTLAALGRFLRWPLKTFYTDRLALYFTADDTALADDETFTVDGLEKWQLSNAVLAQVRTALAQQPDADAEMLVTMATQRLVRTGELPLPPFAQQWSEALLTTLQTPVARYQALLKQFALALPGEAVALEIPPSPPFAKGGDQAGMAGIFLEDTLAAVRTDDAGNRVRLQLQASRLHVGTDLKWTLLAPVWPEHLAAQLTAPTTTHVLGPDTDFQIAPLPAATAQTHLLALLAGYRAALTAPLPLACKTGFAWLAAQAGTPVNPETAYEGEEFKRDSNPGEMFEHPGYRRFWPTYAELEADERFQPLLAQLYQPLFDHARPGSQPVTRESDDD
ncbi:exodeoxyribonuclease V subunit gamma [Chromatium okenii]|uniref:exodeoxyribonuclease V subunit gamma n=1 Tax=Chromatium okenii TaxID=61644 RepID=UPI001904AB63|nr:exodeoxyribonuclease V subunit gamma [Chromatium okenii]MBK1641720.1 exodeoxyribonuclease V subunit gamma [Chromatium okenii]